MARRRTPKPIPKPVASPATQVSRPAGPVQSEAATQAAAALLADARREADVVLAASQERAMEIVRAAQEQQEQVRVTAAAQAAQVLAGAEGEASQVVEEAQQRTNRIRTDADTEAVGRQAEAELAAQRVEKTAQTQADEVRDLARKDAEQVAENARARADRITGDAAGQASSILDEASAQAQQAVVAATAEAERIIAEGKSLSARSTAAAQIDAQRIRDEARQYLDSIKARTTKKQRRDEQIDDWSPRIALGAVIGLTASGEYQLAELAGWYSGIAWLLPLGIDVYVVQALRRHRDVFPALILMVAANAVYHLAAAGLFGVRTDSHGTLKPEWWLIAAVAAIAPWVMLRIHRITAPPRARRSWRRERRQVPVDEPAPAMRDTDSGAHDERAQAPAEQHEEAPTVSVAERSPSAPTERPQGRPDERAQTPKSERAQRAHSKPKKRAQVNASKTLTERRTERVLQLYRERGKRPEWTDIRDALVAAKLADKTISRSSCQRVRDAIETEHPELAALGSENVRAITGS